jgi:starch-binding outer membrane protein, SusD/RagB family
MLDFKKVTMKKKIIIKLTIVAAFLGLVFGCNEVDDQLPQNALPADDAFTTPQGARAALIGAYDAFQSANYYGTRYLLFPDMQGGNLSWTGTFPSFGQIANRGTLTDNVEVTNMWAQIYNGINRTNQILDKAAKVDDPAFSDKNNLLGEAAFLRAFNYFNLVRYWGGVPIKLTPTDNVDIEELQQPRDTVTEVYSQILVDLNFAIANMPATQTSRARATVAAARALKARVHLYRSSMGMADEWSEAISEAAQAATGRTLAPVFNDLFLSRSGFDEVIWFIESNSVDQNTIAFFLLPSTSGGRNELRPTTALQNAYPAGDARAIPSNAVDHRLKYYRVTTGDDYVIIFRLAEMTLIQAEALVERNTGTDLADAVVLINQIRGRAGIGVYSGAVTQDALQDEVFLQRRLELALEGHYFFDLVRTGRAATELSNPVWDDNHALLPIPQRERQANPMLRQNDGY